MTKNTLNILSGRRGSVLAEAGAKCNLIDLNCGYMNSEHGEEKFVFHVLHLSFVLLTGPMCERWGVSFPGRSDQPPAELSAFDDL